MGEQQSSEKDRRFFRIQDRVYFSYQLLPDTPDAAAPVTPITDDTLQNLPDQLSALTHESRPAFRKLLKDAPEAAAAIAILDKKINLLATALLSQNMSNAGKKLTEISLSASGVGFASTSPLPANALLEMTLLIPPALYKIVVKGKAVYCRIKEDGPLAGQYWIGVDFCELDERDQEFLSAHVLKKQAEEIKHQRELDASRLV